MYKSLFLALALFSAAPAYAQLRFSAGPQLGYTLSTTSDDNPQYRSGFSGGITGEVGVGHLVIRPAVVYAQKGYNQKYTNSSLFSSSSTSVSSRTRIDYLAIPLNIGYAEHQDGQGFQGFLGAYLGFVLGGQYTDEVVYANGNGSGTRQETMSGRVVANDGQSAYNTSYLYVHPRDFGMQGGVGYRYHGLLAQLEYSHGLQNVDSNNLLTSTYRTATYYNRVFHLSLTYLFGSKP